MRTTTTRTCATLAVAAATVLALLAPSLQAGRASAATTTATVTSATVRTASAATVFRGGLYVQPDGQAAQAAASMTAAGDSAGAAAAGTIAKQPVAIWLGEWFTGDTLDRVLARNVAAAERAGTTPVFVTYAIPGRDCGGYSAGGLSPAEYLAWNQRIATDLAGHRSVVLVEPDSLSQLTTCPSAASVRLPLVAQAAAQFRAAGVPSYLDGGNATWNAPEVQASRLQQAGIADARGFFTNVANFQRVDTERAYADRLSALTGDSHYVIDVGRNGQGWKGTWCNPAGAGLGQAPHVAAGTTGLDALLWVKTPGASDGTCNGGPAAGTWFRSYAIELVRLGRV